MDICILCDKIIWSNSKKFCFSCDIRNDLESELKKAKKEIRKLKIEIKNLKNIKL